MSNVRSIAPATVNINLANSKELQEAHTSFKNIITHFADEIDVAYEYVKTAVSSDPIKAESEFYADLNTKLSNFSVEFIDYWLDEYETAHEAVKQKLNEILGDNNVYFKKYNESIGCIKDFLFAYDKSTVSVIDADHIAKPIIYTWSSTVDNSLDRQTQVMCLEMSKLTNSVFRHNIRHLGEIQKMNSSGDGSSNSPKIVGTSTTNHGCNLSVDAEHIHRIASICPDILGIINNDLKDLKRQYYFIQNSTNKQEIKRELITFNIEDIETRVNLLKHKIYDNIPASDRTTFDIL